MWAGLGWAVPCALIQKNNRIGLLLGSQEVCRYQLPGTWYLVPGMVPGTVFHVVPGTWFMVTVFLLPN